MTTLSPGVARFYPIASLTTQDGATASRNAFDGAEHCSFPVFENVFLFPVAVSYGCALLGISNSIINVYWRGRQR